MGIPVVLAIFVGLACSFVQSLGLTIQRKSHVQDDALPPEERRRAVRRPLWIIGFAVYISSNVFGSVFQIGALPIVVLAPLGGISLLWNSLLAHIILGEGFTHAMMLGTVLIAGGAVLIAIFGVVPDGNHSLDEILELWARGPFVAFFAVVCVLVALVLAAAHLVAWYLASTDRIRLPADTPSNYASPRSEAAIPFRPTQPGDVVSPISVNPNDTKTVRFAQLEDVLPSKLARRLDDRQRTQTLCGLAFAAASGTLSGLCLVLAKAAVELVIATIDHWTTGRGQNEFTRVQTWFLVAGLGVAAILQLVYLNYSLTFASPALVCPLAFCFFNLASIFDGLIFYNQLGRLALHQVLLMSLGVAVLLVGVWVVSAIQPTGDGGIEVGTWVEEEALEDAHPHEAHDELEAGEGATFLGGDEVVEPTEVDLPESPSAVADGPPSPTSLRRRRPRYGTLIPDLANRPAMPTGFAFGIGAASPGFALRSHSTAGSGRRNTFSHSRSNSLSGLPALRRVETDLSVAGDATGDTPASAPEPGANAERDRRRRPRPLSFPASAVPPSLASAPARDSNVEDALAAWEHERRNRQRPPSVPEHAVAEPSRWPWRVWRGGVRLK